LSLALADPMRKWGHIFDLKDLKFSFKRSAVAGLRDIPI
jgi:hypothetical protein